MNFSANLKVLIQMPPPLVIKMLLFGLVVRGFIFGFNGVSAWAQEVVKFAEPGKITHLGTFHYSNKQWTQSDQLRAQQETIFDNTNGTGGFLPPNQVGAQPPVEFLDWGQSNGGTIEGFQVGYATPRPGPLSLKMIFYYNTDGASNGTEIANFDLIDLPGSTSGQVETFTVDVDISDMPFVLPPGNFGYSYVINDNDTGPLTADGGRGVTDFYRLPPSLTNLQIAGFFAQFHLRLTGALLQMIFVNNAGLNGDGSFLNPFDNLSAAALLAGLGYTIFVYSGSGPYDGGFVMKAAQKLIGSGVDWLIGGQVIEQAGPPPVVTNSSPGANGVTLANDSKVAGVNINNPSGTGIFANGASGQIEIQNIDVEAQVGMLVRDSFAEVNVVRGEYLWKIAPPSAIALSMDGGAPNITFDSESSINTTGTAIKVINDKGTLKFDGEIEATDGAGLQFNKADGEYNFNGQATLNGGDAAIDILNSLGSFNFFNIDIINPTGIAFYVDGGSANVNYTGGSITQINPPSMVCITKWSNGNIIFTSTNFNDPVQGPGHDPSLLICDIDAGNVTLTGEIPLGPFVDGFTADRTVFCTTSTTALTVSNAGGDAVSITNSANSQFEFGALNIDDAQTGVHVENPGGSFIVTGDGTPSSGGTIQNTTNPIFVLDAKFVAIQNMILKAFSGSAIEAENVEELKIENVTIEESSGTLSASKGSGQVRTLESQNNSALSVTLDSTTTATVVLENNVVTTGQENGVTIQTIDFSSALVTLTNNDVSAATNDFQLIQDSSSTFQLAGFAGGDSAAVAAFIQDNNVGMPSVAVSGSISADPAVSVDEPNPTVIPTEFSLAQNYPNPFNPSTTIQFDLPRQSEVTLSIYNINGQLVRTLVSGELAAGSHSVVWDGRDDRARQVTSGLYITELKAGKFKENRKMLLIK